jgi:hypothetical protein
MAVDIDLNTDSETTRSQIRRAENVQVAVAVAVVGGSLTLYTSHDLLGTIDPIFTAILSIISSLFLIGKVATLSLRPYIDWEVLDQFDQFVLPLSFTILFGPSAIVTIVVIISRFAPAYDGVIGIESLLELLTSFPNVAIIVTAIVSIVGGVLYARKTSQTMSEIQSGVPNTVNVTSSGVSNDDFEIRLNNRSDHEITPEAVEIAIESTAGLDIDVNHAEEIRDDVYQLLRPIPAETPVTVSMNVTRSESSDSISERAFDVVVRHQGNERGRHHVTFTG